MDMSDIENFPSEKTRLPEPNLETLKRDIAALGAFELPEEPNALAAASEGWMIDPVNITWWKGLTEEEQVLIKGATPWQLNELNRPEPIGDLYIKE